jgi:alkylation response protein AidB-like acyl-CoA dehydrogenase
MTIAITDDHLALQAVARRFVTDRCPPAVVRAAMDDPTALPPFWAELVALEWLTLDLPELAVVLEELGRAMAPGPFLPTVWARAVMGGEPDVTTGAVALGGPVLCGAQADVIVAEVDGRWAAHRDFTATPVDALDLTRPLAHVELHGPGEPLDVDRATVEAVGAALVAAECAGGAAWCVETAAAHAATREQFGQPIGRFQAVKHRCADMLVAAEQARAVAWDACTEVDDPIATATAGAVAPDAYVRVAKDCIQVLGGIGFTWEHDAHLHLRRATTLRQLLGGTAPWRRTVATTALAGHRRRLTLALPDEAEAVRPAIAAFADSIAALEPAAQRTALVDGGWFVPHWPAPWGRDASPVEQLVIDEELRRVKARRPNLAVGAWAAPTIAVHGTPEQQERWVRPTLLGEIDWCQLFSEPGAGSDLAALSTTATRTDGGWLLNGQKVWTSLAKEADWGICLVRTNRQAPKHLGITYVIVDMRAPGIDIRPLRELTGMAMFNEVFFDDVFVPDDCVIGEVDGGWPLARTTLANERVAMGSGSSFGGGVEALLELVGRRGDDDPLTIDAVGALVAEAQTVALLGLRTTLRSLTSAAPGPEASIRKLLGVEHDQRTQEVGLGLLGPEGATVAGDAAQWTFGFLANRCLTIAGGTSEIQRNVIAERLLGLPRDRSD